ncbi:uncharacterized protein LOC128894085 [Hylaeus anthracinus]|uniref:uncharacterized protein LOC128894085 n=1 Tax=Hylaeus anthracinus TaxID=313031 RepID=UPI0023B8F29F|nr:uncharacterized protein LOC128894085 [Hylaeus anthracinus]
MLTFLTPVMTDTPITDSVSKEGDGVEEEEPESEQDDVQVHPEASQPGSSECERAEKKVIEGRSRKEQTPCEPSSPKSPERQEVKRKAVDDDLHIRELSRAVIQSLA